MRPVVLALCMVMVGSTAFAEEDAKTIFDRGQALFALHKFREAADLFEKAFELRPDPAILYNAAQAHRLAGNKTRALDLYESLLRLYGDRVQRAEIEQHVANLKKAIAAEGHASSAPPAPTKPTPQPLKPVAQPVAQPPKPAPQPTTTAKATEPPAPRVTAAPRVTPPPATTAPRPSPAVAPAARPLPSLALAPSATPTTVQHEAAPRRRWLWPVVAGAAAVVIAGATVGIVLGTRKTVPPNATFGTVQGN